MGKVRDLFCLAARLAVGGVLIYSGFIKAMGPSAEFAAALAAYKLFPSALLSPLSIAMPYVEMWIGLFVLTGFYTRKAAFVSAGLFAVFLTVLTVTVVRGIDIASCGCFGSNALSPRQMIFLDIGLLGLSLLTAALSKFPPRWSLDQAQQ